jgi:gamma-glutamylcyclotransferase (GGCT)/AIG2-like uncharacterized protein YtfP
MITAFVYGTLRQGEANDIFLAAAGHGIAAPSLLGHASLRGRLYDFGDYPGLRLESDGPEVFGEVYQIDPALVPVLDEIEDIYPGREGLFVRQHTRVEVHLDGQARVFDCLFYPVSLSAAAGRPMIAGGDWVAYRLNKMAQAI